MSADDLKPKARPSRKPVKPPETGQTPIPLPKAVKPSVNHAPKRKPYPRDKEPKKPAKKPVRKPVEAEQEPPRTIRMPKQKTAPPSRERAESNPTDASNGQAPTKTLKQHLEEITGGLGLQLSEANAGLRGRRPKISQLTPKVLSTVCLMIKAGAYPSHAAQAAGITPKTWGAWMKKGEDHIEENRHTPYAELFLLISKVTGEAIVLKTLEAVSDDPKFYLTHGPGKSRPGREGFSPSIKIEGGTDPIQVEHNHGGKIEIEGSPHFNIDLRQNTGIDVLAEVMGHLQDVGIAAPKRLLEAAKPAIDTKLTEAIQKEAKKEAKNAR